MKKKLLSILVVLAMVVAMLPAFTMTALAKPQIIPGSNVTWELTEGNTVLTIGGTGAMPNFSNPYDRGWKNYTDKIITVVIQSGVTNIGKNAFYECKKITSVTIPSSVTTIGDHAFYNCIELESVTIPSSVTTIGEHAFQQCSKLTSVTIPSSVTTIGTYAFQGCTNLASVTIPSSVTTIGNYAFQQCYKLENVIVKATTPPTLGGDAFKQVGKNCKIYVPNGCGESYKQKDKWSSYKDNINEAYMVNVDDTTNGTVEVDKYWFAVDTFNELQTDKTVIVTVKPNDGYQLKLLKYNDGTDHDITNDGSGYKFTMPNANVTVTAEFELIPEKHIVKAEVEGSHGKATVVNSEKQPLAKAVKDTEITFIATPNSGYEFDYWEVVKGGITLTKTDKVKSTLKVKMPDEDLTLKAYFKESEPEIIKGNDQKVKVGTKEEVSFTSSAPFDTFKKVLVDGKEITKDEDYTVKEGSTIVTLKPEYVATLKAGEHKVEIVSEGGTATAKLTITDTPETADANNMLIWIVLALAAISLTTCTVLRVKRTNK